MSKTMYFIDPSTGKMRQQDVDSDAVSFGIGATCPMCSPTASRRTIHAIDYAAGVFQCAPRDARVVTAENVNGHEIPRVTCELKHGAEGWHIETTRRA